jgi:hypothetical protein
MFKTLIAWFQSRLRKPSTQPDPNTTPSEKHVGYREPATVQENDLEAESSKIHPRKTSSFGNDDLTAWECEFIARNWMKCPDCEKGDLLQGPSGGCSVNVLCDLCGAELNITVMSGRTVSGHRLPNRGRHLTLKSA